jgi:hypothetical protein
MNKLSKIFNKGIDGLVETSRGKGMTFLKRRFTTRNERMRALLEDSDVEFLLLIAYNLRTDDMLTGNSCETGCEVALKVGEVVL